MSVENSIWYLVKPGSENYFGSIAFASYNANNGGDCTFISHDQVTGTYVPSGGGFVIKIGSSALWTGAVKGRTGSGFATNLACDNSTQSVAIAYNLTCTKPANGKLDKNSEGYSLLQTMGKDSMLY